MRSRISALGGQAPAFSRGDGKRVDAISIAFSEAGNNALPWQVNVDAQLDGGSLVRVGTMWTVPPLSSGLPSRIIGTAICPGAVKWFLGAFVAIAPNRPLVGAAAPVGFFAPTLGAAVSQSGVDVDISAVDQDLGQMGGVYPNTILRTFRSGVNFNAGTPIANPAAGTFLGPLIGVDPAAPSALVASQNISGPCYFKQIFGSNEAGAQKWVQIYDFATVPGAGQTGFKYEINVPAGATFSLDVRTEDERAGDFFFNGVVWVVSSTAGTFTADAGPFQAQVQLGL